MARSWRWSATSTGKTTKCAIDVASPTQIGDAIPLVQYGHVVRWRAFDDSLLLRGSTGVSSLKEGVQTLLFADPQGLPFDTYNGASPEAVFRFHDARGNTIQRWDGVTSPTASPPMPR